jgi:hypothetical protein
MAARQAIGQVESGVRQEIRERGLAKISPALAVQAIDCAHEVDLATNSRDKALLLNALLRITQELRALEPVKAEEDGVDDFTARRTSRYSAA